METLNFEYEAKVTHFNSLHEATVFVPWNNLLTGARID